MKIACLTLLLANLLFFGWTRWVAPAPAAPLSEAARKRLPQLVLVNETVASGTAASGEKPAANSGAENSDDSESAAASAQRCSSIGPFQDVPATNQAAAVLRGKGYEPKMRVVEGDVRAGLWVHLENLPARAEAQRAMTVLKQRGIADAYLMPHDGTAADKWEISLGIFSEPARAQRRADDVRAMGLKPSVTDRRKGASYWLDVGIQPGDAPLDPVAIQEGSDKTGSIVRVGLQPCPD